MTEAIHKAARWLATTPEAQRPHPIIPHLQKSFCLTAKQACDVIREANLIRARAN